MEYNGLATSSTNHSEHMLFSKWNSPKIFSTLQTILTSHVTDVVWKVETFLCLFSKRHRTKCSSKWLVVDVVEGM